jgi:maleylpyruvate isomerase
VKLYGYWRSSASWRVRIGLAWKGLAYDYEAVHLIKDGGEQLAERYRAVNPMAQVPTLELTHGGRTVRLSQSLAILEFLEEIHPEPPLLPRDPYLRARARLLAEIVNAGIQPLQNLSVMREVKHLGGDEKAWAQRHIDRGLRALAASAAETAGTYLVGDEVSIADVCLIPQLYGARRNGVDLGPLPLLTRVEAACMQLPAFQTAHADRQPDATP